MGISLDPSSDKEKNNSNVTSIKYWIQEFWEKWHFKDEKTYVKIEKLIKGLEEMIPNDIKSNGFGTKSRK